MSNHLNQIEAAIDQLKKKLESEQDEAAQQAILEKIAILEGSKKQLVAIRASDKISGPTALDDNVHYATDRNDRPLIKDTAVLYVDSGGQVRSGTVFEAEPNNPNRIKIKTEKGVEIFFPKQVFQKLGSTRSVSNTIGRVRKLGSFFFEGGKKMDLWTGDEIKIQKKDGQFIVASITHGKNGKLVLEVEKRLLEVVPEEIGLSGDVISDPMTHHGRILTTVNGKKVSEVRGRLSTEFGEVGGLAETEKNLKEALNHPIISDFQTAAEKVKGLRLELAMAQRSSSGEIPRIQKLLNEAQHEWDLLVKPYTEFVDKTYRPALVQYLLRRGEIIEVNEDGSIRIFESEDGLPGVGSDLKHTNDERRKVGLLPVSFTVDPLLPVKDFGVTGFSEGSDPYRDPLTGFLTAHGVVVVKMIKENRLNLSVTTHEFKHADSSKTPLSAQRAANFSAKEGGILPGSIYDSNLSLDELRAYRRDFPLLAFPNLAKQMKLLSDQCTAIIGNSIDLLAAEDAKIFLTEKNGIVSVEVEFTNRNGKRITFETPLGGVGKKDFTLAQAKLKEIMSELIQYTHLQAVAAERVQDVLRPFSLHGVPWPTDDPGRRALMQRVIRAYYALPETLSTQ